MKGARPLTDSEIAAVLNNFSGPYALRDKALFILGIKAGYRISEMLSLRVCDVWQANDVAERVSVQRKHMKGHREGRTVILNPEARAALKTWITALAAQSELRPDGYVFRSRKGSNRPISRVQACRILQRAFRANNLISHYSCHSLRKTFADRIYEKVGRNLFLTQQALSHKNINSTISYLSFKEDQIDQAILSL